MYGLINEAIRGLVVEQNGAAAWEGVLERANVDYAFTAMAYYDDDVTYALVGAASEELGLPADELLRSFGRYWSVKIAPEHPGGYVDASGRELHEILSGLDAMHARLQALFPELRPPSIKVEGENHGPITVHYHSEREGLAPFVVGLLEGVGELCGERVTVTQTGVRGDQSDHDVFRIDRVAR